MTLLSSFLLLTTACLASTVSISPRDPVIEGTELVFAFMTHRHGDRTPISTSISIIGDSVNTTLVDELIAPYGYGQLTDVGKRSGYKTGQFIRRRYNEIIAPKYNKSEMYIRSTDSTRVKKTILTALSAIFPAGPDNWSDEINWDPVTYTTVPAKYDYNEAAINCPNFLTGYYSLMAETSSRFDPYNDTIAAISEIIGTDITSEPVYMSTVYDVFVSLQSLGYDIPDEITALWDDMREAAGIAWDISTGNADLLSYQAGPLLYEFFEYADLIIAGNDTQKVRIYAAHDFNVYSFEAITQVGPRQGAPKYASLYSLELRRVAETGKYVVLPVYLADPNEGVEMYLEVVGCGSLLCDYDTFYSITSDYVIDEDTWRSNCGFTNDLTIDTTSID